MLLAYSVVLRGDIGQVHLFPYSSCLFGGNLDYVMMDHGHVLGNEKRLTCSKFIFLSTNNSYEWIIEPIRETIKKRILDYFIVDVYNLPGFV